MATLGSKSAGSIVKIKETDNVYHEYIIVQQNMNDASITGFYGGDYKNSTFLMRNRPIEPSNLVWSDNTTDITNYSLSNVHKYLNNDFINNIIPDDLREQLLQINIPYEEIKWDVIQADEYQTPIKDAVIGHIKTDGLPCYAWIPTIHSFNDGNLGGDEVLSDYIYDSSHHNPHDLEYVITQDDLGIDGGNGPDYCTSRSVTCHIVDTDDYPSDWDIGSDYYFANYWHLGVFLCVRKDFDSKIHVNPIIALPKSMTIDSSGNIVTNTAPTTPSSITVPSTLKENVSSTISWGTSTDSDGNLSGYILEQKLNGGSWSQIYKGSKRSKSITPQASWNTVAYRVKSYDTENAMSGYKTSATVTVQHNSAPSMPKWCSVPDPVKGGTSIKITWPASTDPDGNISGYILQRKFNSNSWTQIYKGANRSYTDPIPLDKYKTVTYRVKAYDTENAQSSYATSVTRTIQNSTVLQFRLKTPIESQNRAIYGQEIMTYTIPSGATFKAEACNNGFDKNPTWEDITEFVKKQKIFEFANKTKTASKWGYDIRVTVDRNGATGDCYFTKGNGFFEETDEIDPPDPNKLPDAGGTFTCFGIEWLVLHNYNNEVLCITKDIIDLSVFGPTTYGYNRSTLRANCLSFGRQINISSSDFIMIDPHGQYTDEIFIPHQTILTSGHFDDEKNRIAYYNGSAAWYWTSTLQKISQDEYGNPLAITQSGTITNSANPSIPCGMRPCIYIDQSKYKSE